MATTIQLLRSDISQQRPDPGVLANGIPMVNLYEDEPGLFFAARDGSLFKVGPTAVGPQPPNSTPQGSPGNSLGELWVDTSGAAPLLKFFDGSSFVSAFTAPSSVTSVGLTFTDLFQTANSPITGSGTFVVSPVTQPSNKVLAGPVSGLDSTPTFRSLVDTDIPSLPASKVSSGVLDPGRIPNLDASKVSSGVFSSARIPTLPATSISYTRASVGANTTTVQLKLEEGISVKDFGAVGDGSTDDTIAINEAIAAASTGQSILLPPGTYKVGSIIFPGPVIFDGGALDSTGTITFKSPIQAGLNRIFRGGTFEFDCAITGYPEWWGAGTVESGGPATGIDNEDAIKACFDACHVTELQAGTYYTTGPVYLETSGRILRGAANQWGPGVPPDPNGYNGTRITILNASDEVLFIRTDTSSTDNTTYVRNVSISDLQLTRGNPSASTAVGLKTYKIIDCEFKRVRSQEHYRPFYISGAISCTFTQCIASGTVGLQNPAAVFSGFYFDGFVDIALAGGNASVYMVECSAGTAIGIAQYSASYGMHLTGKYADTYLLYPEVGSVDVGIFFEGDPLGPNDGAGEVDAHVVMPIVDVFFEAAIRIKDQKSRGMISINGGYAAPFAASADLVACLDIVNSVGQVSVSDFECTCWPPPNGPTVAGVSINSASRGVSITNLKITGSNSPIIIDGDYNLVQASTYLDAATGAAIVNITGDRNEVSIGGWGNTPAVFTDGVNVSGDRNEISVTRLDPAIVTNVVTNTGANNVVVGFP